MLRLRRDDDLTQLLAKLPKCLPSIKVQITVDQDLLQDVSEFLEKIVIEGKATRDQVSLVSVALGNSMHLLLGLPEKVADSLVLSEIRSLGNGKYQVISITTFESLDPVSQKAWRFVAYNYPPIRQGNVLRPSVSWRDVLEAIRETPFASHTTPYERVRMFELREYQQYALDALRAYFQTCVQLDQTGSPDAANLAFYQHTLNTFGRGVPYRPVPELQGLPYVCLRLPTGGGKTFVACHAIHIAAKDLLQTDESVVLWLVPSNAIREQTLNALRNRQHPYRRALEETLGAVTIMDISEARYVTPSMLSISTTIIVSTIQAFRIEETEGRKVYESSGALMDHFSGYRPEALAELEKREDGTPIYSLANVLKLHRPVVIVDEAHNARTELSFATLARFHPSCIIEFTATPDSDKSPSNVLYSVSAAELKAEDMIKMPILLETRLNWRELLTDAIAKLDQLDACAQVEGKATGEYIRPIMLLQAQPRRGKDAITIDVVEQCLLDDFRIPKAQIARATGSDRELDGVDVLDPKCPIRYIITVQALREGWDCPFAYILCSVTEMRSSTAIEQILGRVMRLPHTKRKQHEVLNQAYAYAASANFAVVAQNLVDGLVQNGFDRIEAQEMIIPSEQLAFGLDELPLFTKKPHTVTIAVVAAQPQLDQLPPETANKINVGVDGAVIFTGPMDDQDRAALEQCFNTDEGLQAVDQAFEESLALHDPRSPAERGIEFSIPVLAYQQGELPLEPFEQTHFQRMLDLSQRDATLTEQEFPSIGPQAQQAQIDIAQDRRLSVEFLTELHQQMRLLASDRGWTIVELVHWLDHAIPRHHTITHSESSAFLYNLVQKLLDERCFALAQLVHDKYRLRAAVITKIEAHLYTAREEAYQPFLDLDTSPLIVTPECCFTYDPQRYPSPPYRGRYSFQKHYYKLVGTFDSGEEEQCAQFIDVQTEIEFWVRNPARGSKSFWLQTYEDKFYPDFVCRLHDGRHLVVEYKGQDRWSNDDSKRKRAVGELWEKRSNGDCLFIMPKGKQLGEIKAKMTS
ncbi:MAG: DEAD/DEAH box helicase family protein [Chloroflexi bacterium]|nr:DEAD/DEAH box helicase family protein [Chloroflexota bacterium]